MRTVLTGIKAIVPNARSTAFRGDDCRPFCLTVAVLPDAAHSQREKRFRAIGHTDKGRGVFMVFTFRKKRDEVLIRPISARYMHKKEVDAYEKENPNL